MSSIPSNLTRVPNILASRIALASLNRTNVDLLTVQQQISSGKTITRASDDIVKAATISVLNDRLSRSDQIKRNLSHASASLGVLDSLLQEANNAAQEGKSIASQQVGTGTSSTERASQATVVDQLLTSLLNTANRQSVAGYITGGQQTSQPPVSEFLNGFRYNGTSGTAGLATDLDLTAAAPITIGAGPLAGVATVHGGVDLNPALSLSTQLSALNGARGLGITPGTIQLSISGSAPISVDLAGAATVQDVATRITASIHQYESANSVTVLGPGGVSVSGGAISIDVAAGSPPAPGPTVQFFDIGTGVTGQDLGLVSNPPSTFSSSNANGADLNPKLTWQTPVSALTGVAGPLGQIKVSNAGQTTTLDLSGAQTLEDVRNIIQSANLGIHAEINAAGTGVDIVNEVSAGSTNALSISDPAGGNTATALGIRTFSASTAISSLNFGRGVGIVDNQKDPTTGTVTRALNTDIRITLGDSAATTLDIDLRPQDMTNIQSVIDRINAEAAPQLAAAGLPPTAFSAGLANGANGLALSQDPSYGTPLKATALNNSPAAAQLGLTSGTYDTASATLIGEDRAKVRVDSLFTHLIDLRDALRTNDTIGIGLAGDDIGKSSNALVDLRGQVGGTAQQVDAATARESERATLDQQTRSDLQDTDFAAAATRFSMLQTQLQAGLQMTALSHQKSLLDFLG